MAAAAAGGQACGPPPRPRAGVTVLLVVLWYVSSMLAITTSKLTMQAARVPLVLCSAQFLCATLVARAVLALQDAPRGVARAGLGVLVGIAWTYTLGFFFTNLAFSLAHASFVETVKAGEPISTVALAFLLLGERERPGTYAALAPVVAGVAMASSGEASGSLAAFTATAGSNFGFSARAVFAKQLKRDFPDNPAARNDICLFYHISWMGLLALVPLAAAAEGLTLVVALASESFDATRFGGVMLLNGLMYTAYNQFSFLVLSRVSTAAHAVLNVCRRVCVIGVTSLLFGNPLSAVNIVGVAVAVAGMFWFSHSKSAAVAKKRE